MLDPIVPEPDAQISCRARSNIGTSLSVVGQVSQDAAWLTSWWTNIALRQGSRPVLFGLIGDVCQNNPDNLDDQVPHGLETHTESRAADHLELAGQSMA